VTSVLTVYWLTNIAGLLLLHHSAHSLSHDKQRSRSFSRQVAIDVAISCGYTLLVAALAYFNILPVPEIPW
jgi:uncharacterized membrane protein